MSDARTERRPDAANDRDFEAAAVTITAGADTTDLTQAIGHSAEVSQQGPSRRPEVTSRIMSAVRSRDTKPELALRRALHAEGLRFRVDAQGVLGRPDIVNRSRRVAVFVDGDFWHANPDGWTRRGFASMEQQFPAEKREAWTAKLNRNAERDRHVTKTLERDGWSVVRVWESEIAADLEAAVARVVQAWEP